MDAHEILKYFAGRQDAILDAIREVVDLESPSHDAVRSRQVADWVERQAMSTGLDLAVERISVEPGEHIVIRTFPGEQRQTLLLGHTDTVHPVGAPNETRIDGDKFYGRGIFDMKANIVLALEALRYLVQNGIVPATPVTMLLSCDEEVGSHTGRPIVEREAAISSRCLVLEPSAEGRVKTGRKGTGNYTLRVHGVPAHAGLEPEKGVNAITELARHIDEIHSIQQPDDGTTVNVCMVRGGTATNVIPAVAECDIDVRFTTMREGERVDAALREITAVDERATLELSGGINRPPLERTPEIAALFEKARDLAASFDYELDETQVGGASDGNFVAAMGTPVLDGLGLAGAGAHTLDEYVLVSDIAKRATLLTLLLASH
jgi:glutamate carboxypeptidase